MKIKPDPERDMTRMELRDLPDLEHYYRVTRPDGTEDHVNSAGWVNVNGALHLTGDTGDIVRTYPPGQWTDVQAMEWPEGYGTP